MPAEEAIMPNTSLIFSGGLTPNDATLEIARTIQNVDLVIAADSGLHTAQKLNMHVDFVVGDFDSVDASALARATSAHTQAIRHSADKDFTDLESALLLAVDKNSQHIIIVTAGGGRLDHQFGFIAAMFNPKLRNCKVEALWQNNRLFALQGPANCDIATQVGDTVAIQSFSDKSEKISTTGLQWQLTNESLNNFETRGVSNIATKEQVSVSVELGQLLVIHQPKGTS
ncbi:MAG: thiamine diphosphokinase [Ilumatobacteraceae bacterium]|jgi:thiamine pyrophosphokinase|nr:thiamine diphosphokinase [Ilumatobacteraceae bacterium]